MKMIRRLTILTAAILLLAAFTGGGTAEVTEEKKETGGRTTSVAWKDENGKPAAGPEGYAEIRYTYDSSSVKEAYFDAEGAPFQVPGGYYGRNVTRDGKNRIKSIEYLGKNGELTLNGMGYAMVGYTYVSFGEVRKVVFYGTNRKAIMVHSLGYAQMENEYSGATLTKRTYMNAAGKPVDIPAGYAVMKFKMKDHKITRIWYTHADGKPATGPDGWYKCEQVWDTKGRISVIRFLDTEEKLTDRGGYARETYTYGSGLVTVVRYNAQDDVIPISGEAVSVRRKMSDGKILEETYLNAAGQPAALPEGYTTVSYTYNKAGQLEMVQYRDGNGDKLVSKQGYSAIRQTWNNGLLQRRTYLDENGLNVNNLNGVCEEEYLYDEEGRMTEVRKYDASGNVLITR